MDPQIKSVTDKLLGWVKNQGTAQKARSGISGWLIGVGVAAVAFAGLAILYWRSANLSAKVSAYQHAKEVAEQAAQVTKAQAQLAQNEGLVNSLNEMTKLSEARVREMNAMIQLEDGARAKTLHEIDNIKNWRDLDRYLGGGDPPTPSGGAT